MRILPRRILVPLNEFIKKQQSSGVVLIAATALSLFIANTQWGVAFHHTLETQLGFQTPGVHLKLTLHHWINDGLMALFFLLVGLEIKREVLFSNLSNLKSAMLPLLAALGGMLVPAMLYLFFNKGTPQESGWGIPMATDIAFALGILSLLGDKVPAALKVFLTAFAVIDDLGAIIIIALFYSAKINVTYLLLAGFVWLVLLLLNRLKVRYLVIYLLLGLVLWYCMFQSGIHATLAGVLLALTIPVNKGDEKKSALEKLERSLHIPVTFLVMPIFALANTAIAIHVDFIKRVTEPMSIGIFLGLCIGKPLGIYAFTRLGSKLGLTHLHKDVSWKQILGAGMLGGIGFTMSIFISLLAFKDIEHQELAKLTVLIASLSSATLGYLFLKSNAKEMVIRG